MKRKNENNGCLIAGIAKIEYKNEKGNIKYEKMKFVGKAVNWDSVNIADNDLYFKGVLFDMNNNLQGEFEWNKKEFYKQVTTFTDVL